MWNKIIEPYVIANQWENYNLSSSMWTWSKSIEKVLTDPLDGGQGGGKSVSERGNAHEWMNKHLKSNHCITIVALCAIKC